MKNYILPVLMLVALLISPLTTRAEDVIEQNATLKANIKRAAFEYLEHSVTNKNDPNYPDSYNADEERTIGGVFDGNLTYDRTNMVWVNGLYMDYAKAKTTEKNVTTENEQNDEILLYTDYTHKVWQLEQGVVGPFAYLGYETEFTTFELNNTDYRTKILRAKGGLKLYDGTYFKQLYIALVEEDDMTYNTDNMKTGAEIGYEFNYPLNPNTSFVSEGYYRHFFSYSEKEPTDFEYKLELNNRIETKLTGDLYLAPFYNYELAETRGAKSARAQSTFGISLSYNKSFDLF
ncbi:MAG: hypothetical protein J6C85_03600 [Alphaproteobacteria bacterium]|nr:hypothetical protein [Alphaproteobacteria bacterium]